MNATSERKILMKATPQIVDGYLKTIETTKSGHYRLVFETGESVIMPGSWSVPFDLWEGMPLRAGYDEGRFLMEELEECDDEVAE